MPRCEECLHYELCSYNAYEQAKYFGKDKEIYITIKNNTACKFFKPTADVVEVVRCKDCIHARNMPFGMCYLHTEQYCNAKGYKGNAVCVEPNDFCSYGKRKE